MSQGSGSSQYATQNEGITEVKKLLEKEWDVPSKRKEDINDQLS